MEESQSRPKGLLEALGTGCPWGWRSSGSTGSEGDHGSRCPAAERGWGRGGRGRGRGRTCSFLKRSFAPLHSGWRNFTDILPPGVSLCPFDMHFGIAVRRHQGPKVAASVVKTEEVWFLETSCVGRRGISSNCEAMRKRGSSGFRNAEECIRQDRRCCHYDLRQAPLVTA